MALIKKFQNFEEITGEMLIELIDKILVHKRDFRGRIDSPQTIEIYFNFIGQYMPQIAEERPTPAEIEEAEKKERIRAKRRAQCQRAKASGAYDRYYQKTKDKKIAEMHSKKDALRAEDRANGVYYLPKQDTQRKAVNE
nr:DUF4368 domain-containing protein [Turicibacter sanguinis]